MATLSDSRGWGSRLAERHRRLVAPGVDRQWRRRLHRGMRDKPRRVCVLHGLDLRSTWARKGPHDRCREAEHHRASPAWSSSFEAPRCLLCSAYANALRRRNPITCWSFWTAATREHTLARDATLRRLGEGRRLHARPGWLHRSTLVISTVPARPAACDREFPEQRHPLCRRRGAVETLSGWS